MSKKNDKKHAQTRHAARRALERYGIEFTQHKREKMIKMIQTGEAQVVRKQSHRVTIFSLIFEEKEVVVVYDKERKNIASFLPLEAKDEDIFMGNQRWRNENESELEG